MDKKTVLTQSERLKIMALDFPTWAMYYFPQAPTDVRLALTKGDLIKLKHLFEKMPLQKPD